jgi:hypothetical protein
MVAVVIRILLAISAVFELLACLLKVVKFNGVTIFDLTSKHVIRVSHIHDIRYICPFTQIKFKYGICLIFVLHDNHQIQV